MNRNQALSILKGLLDDACDAELSIVESGELPDWVRSADSWSATANALGELIKFVNERKE